MPSKYDSQSVALARLKGNLEAVKPHANASGLTVLGCHTGVLSASSVEGTSHS